MSEADALSKFDFSKVTGGGLFLKFEPGVPVTLRVLTTDPVVSNETFEDRKTGEEVLSTKFSFIVYNWTDEKAQILKATAATAKRIGDLHVDPDFGANIKKIDIKVTPPNKGEIKAYEIQVLPNAKTLTTDQIKECAAIDLDEAVEGDRMSLYDPAKYVPKENMNQSPPDEVAEVVDGEEINLDDIPF